MRRPTQVQTARRLCGRQPAGSEAARGGQCRRASRSLRRAWGDDQWNTTIYSGNDRYRGIKNLRTLIFMNRHDMRDRDIKEFDDVDIVATARDGSTRSLHRY
jgi:hypothetical protein